MGSRQDKRQKDLVKKKAVRLNKEVLPSFKYLITLAYDGSNYGGYAKQKHNNTIQNELEKVLTIFFEKNIKTIESSRTDAKVHALDQKVMFELNKKIDIKKSINQLNELLNNDIVIMNIEEVNNDFHCRYDVKSKTYEYTITTRKDPRLNNYAWYIECDLNIIAMQKASEYLVGKHDFAAFKSAKATSITSIRTINYLNIYKDDHKVIITINADGFLYNMVRLIVKSLVDVGLNKQDTIYLKKLLDLKYKPDNLESAPANGLCLTRIEY